MDTEMNRISDLNIYLTRMQRSILDKMFFMDKGFEPFRYVLDFGCANGELIMRKEFGMEPQSPEWKAKFAENLTKAEKFMQMFTYACYVNDTAAIIERAKTAQCENYSSKNTVRRGLRNAITQHCSNHRQLQEA